MRQETVAGCGPADDRTLPALGVELSPSRRIFPVPLLPADARDAFTSGGRRSRQRWCRWRRHRENANDAIRGLNWLANAGPPDPGADVSELQLRVQARAVEQSTLYQPAAATISRQAAFRELLRDHALYSDAGVCPSLATFTTTANVSMPTDLEGAPFLLDVLPPGLSPLVNDPERLLRSNKDFEELLLTDPLQSHIGILL